MERRAFSLELEGFYLAGETYIPDQTPCPALCFCHGIPRGVPDPNDPGYPVLAERFCDAGFLTCLFNFRGTGASGGNFDVLGWTRDLRTIIDHVLTLQEVDRAKLCVMGFSAGAAVSAYVASTTPRLSSLVLCACPARFRLTDARTAAQSALEQFRATGIIRDTDFPPSEASWFEGFKRVSPIGCIASISPRSVFIIHGSQDDLVDPGDARALYERANQPKELLIVEGAGHRLRLEERAMAAALEWLTGRVEGN
ncbi:MAG: alpha/beta hydrolase [Chloroflexota bacterium]